MARRNRTPKHIEKDVLVKSARRCCLCYGMRGDFFEKRGQIAHVDRDRSNNHIHNLVFLCLDHHDAYDSIPRQSKGITKEEVLYYRKVLYADVVEHLPRLSPHTENERQKQLAAFIARVRKRGAYPSPLLNGYEIEGAVKEGVLSIDPFAKSRLDLFAYELVLGGEAVVGQTLVTLSPGASLVLKPRELASVITEEFLSLPFGLVGRILPTNVLSRHGLSLTGGTVHPGYRGRLFLTIFNQRNWEVEVRVATEIAKIEFMLFNMPPPDWKPDVNYQLMDFPGSSIPKSQPSHSAYRGSASRPTKGDA